MADLYSRNVNTKFSGLTTTVALFGVVGTLALVGFESMRQMRRLPKTYFARFWKHDPLLRQGGRGGIHPEGDDRGGNAIGSREKLTCEDWEMGHLYLSRQFHATTPSPPMSRWPFAWAWQALKFNDWFYATHSGMDTVVYVRFLRACMWWMLLHTLTTAPILLAIHFHYAVESHKGQSQFSLNDMSQASLSYLVTTTICQCPDGTNQSTPCLSAESVAATSKKTTSVDNYENCQHLPNESGRKLLWVHLLLAWYVTFSWFYALWWIGKGSLRVRRRWVEEIRVKRQKAVEDNQSKAKDRDGSNPDSRIPEEDRNSVGENNPYIPSDAEPRHIIEEKHGMSNLVRGDDHDGWRQRTLLITNLPPTMRDEASIRRYFEEFLRPDEDHSEAGSEAGEEKEGEESAESQAFKARGHTGSGSSTSDDGPLQQQQAKQGQSDDELALERTRSPLSPISDTQTASEFKRDQEKQGPEPDTNPGRHLRSPVQTVVLVRKMNELSAMLTRRQDVLAKLEAAHIKLARSVLSTVGSNSTQMREKDAKRKGGIGGLGGLGKGRIRNSQFLRHLRHERSGEDIEEIAAAKRNEEKQKLDELTRRLARFSPANKGMHVREAQARTGSELGGKQMSETVWEALSEVPRELLDPYQPVTRLSSLFRGQKVPTIDYLLTKLNLLTALVTEMRARPPTSYEPTSTAFVTFRDPRQARMVWRELKTQIVVKVRPAPEVKDLDWERLMRTSFTGDIVRGLGVNAFFWLFTILWVIPVALLTTSLFSVENLEGIFPPLRAFFQDNPRFEGFISVTLPTILVSLLTLAVPELIFQISKRAQGFVTFSALYDQCLCRYWKFIICNVVIFFCIGATTVQSIIFQLGTNNNVLNAVAFSFPTAAPFYISYMILGMGVHTGFELLGFMVPLIQHLGARNAATPRTRALKTLPRNFNRYYWLPIHILIMSIAFLFAILNPLILPFALAYLWVALAVFKKNFAYQYFRRFNEKEGVIYYIRLLRFSLDGLLLAQVVLLVFFSVTRQEGAYIGLMAVLIPINVGVKLMGTRLWKSQCRAVEDDEANALCGIGTSAPLSPSLQRDYVGKDSAYGQQETDGYAFPLDARASGRYPAVVVPTQSGSRLLAWWGKVTDSFHANGNERPSHFVVQHGGRVSVKSVTQAVASAPIAAAKRKAKQTRSIAQVTTGAAPVPANGFNLRKSLAVSSTFPVREEDEDGLSPHEKQTAGPLAGASVHDLKRTLENGDEQELVRRRAGARRTASGHGRSGKGHRHYRLPSEEAPFLSGFEAIANHAPVAGSEDGSSLSSYGDGEYEEMLSLRRRKTADMLRRRQSKYRRSSSQAGGDRQQGYAVDGEARRVPSQAISASPSVADLWKDTEAVTYEQDEESDCESAEMLEGGPLVKPHASVRWDDTPNNHARYNNPFYSVELDPFLWLPRDPLAPVDLCDTIEWHGPALVSSQGGQGRVGEWDDDDESDLQDGADGDEEKNMSVLLQEQEDSAAGVLRFHGDERIEIRGALAQRIQEAEDTDEAADPAASIPRNQLDDFKRALDEDLEVIDEEGRDDTDDANAPSTATIRSPRRSGSMNQHSVSFNSELHAAAVAEGKKTGGKLTRSATHTSAMSAASESLHPERRGSLSVRSPRRTGSMSSKDAGRSQQVSMQRALKAEVLEEEYLRTVKERVNARHARRSENASALSTTREELEDGASESPGSDGAPRDHHQMFRKNTWLRSRKTRCASDASTNDMPVSPSLRPTRALSQREKLSTLDVPMQDLTKPKADNP